MLKRLFPLLFCLTALPVSAGGSASPPDGKQVMAVFFRHINAPLCRMLLDVRYPDRMAESIADYISVGIGETTESEEERVSILTDCLPQPIEVRTAEGNSISAWDCTVHFRLSSDADPFLDDVSVTFSIPLGLSGMCRERSGACKRCLCDASDSFCRS